MSEKLASKLQIRLTQQQREALHDKAKQAGMTGSNLIRYWIDNKQVIERKAHSDKETVTELRKIGGLIKAVYGKMSDIGILNRNEVTSQMIMNGDRAYKDLIEALRRIG
jgi:hypothetical protein